MRNIYFILFLFFGLKTFAAEVDTVSIDSKAMHRTYKAVVIKPGSYKKKNGLFPTVYLLHGHSGDFTDWIKKVPQLKTYADDYQLLIVCPEGTYSSWYWDSPVDTTMRFETYVAKEVPAFIDAHYRTIKDRRARAITGLSMGGHGGLFLGFRHAGFFSACGSMSAAVDIPSLLGRKIGIEKLLGDTANIERYKNYSVFAEMEHYPKDSLAIIMDCGVDDFTIDMNRKAHRRMVELKIPHDYTERPGKHEWPYWAGAIQYQLLYFHNHFQKNKKTIPGALLK